MTLSGPIFPRKGKERKITENSHFSLLLTILGVAEEGSQHERENAVDRKEKKKPRKKETKRYQARNKWRHDQTSHLGAVRLN